MICENCKAQLDPSDHFCRNCGYKVTNALIESTPAAEATFTHEETNDIPAAEKADSAAPKSRLWLLWLVPIIITVLVAAFIYASYLYEKDLNAKVEAMKLQAENAAIEGNFEDAAKLISKALEYRPNYPALKTDSEILKKGENISGILKNVEDLIKGRKYAEALSGLSKADFAIQQDNGVFMALFSKIIDNKRTLINVMQLKDDAGSKESILQLSPIYKMVSAIDTPEALKAAEEIRKRIEDLASNAVKESMKNRDYSPVAEELELALRYIEDDKKLLDLKNDIQKKMDEYEGTLKNIASEVIGKEDTVTSGSLTARMNSSADRYASEISGTVANYGTASYYNVKVQLKVYDEMGNLTDEITVPCDSQTIGPSSNAEFSYAFGAAYPKLVRPVGITYEVLGSASLNTDGNSNFAVN